MDFRNDKKKLMNEIDYIDVLVSTLNNEVDDFMNQIDQIDNLIEDSKNKKNINA